MKIFEIGTGYTSIPAKMGAATEIVVEEMTKSLLKDKQNVTLVDIADSNRPDNNLPIVEVKIPSVFTNTDTSLGIMHKLKRVVYSLKLKSVLKKLIKSETEPVLIHFHNQYNMYFFLKLTSKKLRERVKIAYTVHSYIWPKEWSEIEGTVKKKYFQEIYCVQNADYVLVLNDKTVEHFTNHLGVNNERIYKIKNGVNTQIYAPLTSDENEEFKNSVNLKGKSYVFQVGSVCDRKNQLGAVELMADYLKEHKNVSYVYAGGIIDNEYFESIGRFAKETGIESQVVYAGELKPGETLNKYYSAANLSIFPSKLESFGMVIIEAISSATRVLVAEDIIFPLSDGYTVYNNKEELYSLLDEYLHEKKPDLVGRDAVVNTYSWDVVAREHLEIFLS